MKKIGTKNQQKIDQISQKGIIIDDLINTYGLRFVMRLIKSLIRSKRNKSDTTTLIYPPLIVKPKFNRQLSKQYLSRLKSAGFKLKEWNEDFIDEDNGRIVTIKRREIYFIDLN